MASGQSPVTKTIAQFVQEIIEEIHYYDTILPRIPVMPTHTPVETGDGAAVDARKHHAHRDGAQGSPGEAPPRPRGHEGAGSHDVHACSCVLGSVSMYTYQHTPRLCGHEGEGAVLRRRRDVRCDIYGYIYVHTMRVHACMYTYKHTYIGEGAVLRGRRDIRCRNPCRD